MSQCLQLDVGNSGAKWRLMDSGTVMARGTFGLNEPGGKQRFVNCGGDPGAIWIASVADDAANSELRHLCQQHWGLNPWFARTEAQIAGLSNSYSDPERMGVDRWLAMLGARQRLAGAYCVVDAGSALTIDLVSKQGCHEGGYIIPGPQLMEQSLLRDTDRVRFAEDIPFGLKPGTSTAEAVRHGVASCHVGALKLIMDKQSLTPEQLLFCGGWGRQLRDLVCPAAPYEQDLVFEGLQLQAKELGY